jgi:hypothetical protein
MCHLVALWTVMLRCPRTYSGRPSARLGRSVWAATTVGVRSCDGRCAPSAFPRTATDGRTSGRFRLDQRRSGGLVGASTITLVGHGCGDDRRAYAVRGRSEGNSMGKSACLLDYAGAAEGLGAATGYRPLRRCLALPQELGAERVGVIRRRENPGGGARGSARRPGLLVAV